MTRSMLNAGTHVSFGLKYHEMIKTAYVHMLKAIYILCRRGTEAGREPASLGEAAADSLEPRGTHIGSMLLLPGTASAPMYVSVII